MRLETDRLVLRSATTVDAPYLQTLFSDPNVLRYLPPIPPMTLEMAKERVERRKKMEAELGYAPLIIVLRDAGDFIGSGGVVPVRGTSEVEIAYHFLPSAWGKGYATEAATAILGFAFDVPKLEEVVGFAFQGNVASSRVLEKIGMRYLGLVNYQGIEGLKKHVADRKTWTAPRQRT